MTDSAYQAALKMLSRRDYFRSELAGRLARKGFEAYEIEAALVSCADRGLLDDHGLAVRFVELRATDRGWGPRRLSAELQKRGVDRELAESVSCLEAEKLQRALATALRRAELRLPDGWWQLPDRQARMVSSLLARGFAADDAIAAVSDLAARRKGDHAIDDQRGDPLRIP